MRNKQSLYKNLACLSFCLFLFFMASIFVSETYYNRIINEQIQRLSLLKSVHFEQWGKMQTPSPVIHEFQPYTFNEKGEPSLHKDSMKYEYTFEYKNYSFGQGDTGNIKYLNSWKRELIRNESPSQSTSSSPVSEQSKIKVFNVDAQTVYNYDYYAPDVRQFALTYNVLYNSLSREFIPLFYGQYMYEYLFKNETMVWTRVFEAMKLTKQDAGRIYKHEKYGLNKPQTISKWIQIGEGVEDETFYSLPFYQGLINQLGLTKEQILYIAGPRSSMFGMLMAIKGALRYKLNKMDDSKCGDDYCTNKELMAAQMGTGFLTKQTIFLSTAIGKPINQINTTLLNRFGYSSFCQTRPDLKKCSGDEDNAAMTFFSDNFLANYTEVAYIFNNLNNPDSIESQYILPGEGQSMIEYVKFLFHHTFRLVDTQSLETTIQSTSGSRNDLKQTKNEQSTPNLNLEAFRRSFTNYNHVQQILDNFRDILFVQLHTRAFYTKFINVTNKPKCEDYYKDDFQAYKDDCDKLPLSTLDDVRVYMMAFLGFDVEDFMNVTTMSKPLVNEYLHNRQKSLFAQQAIQMSVAMAKQFSCSFAELCTKEQLLYKEWKDGSVLNNLPKDYFDTPKESISQWDYSKKLKGISPQLHNFITVSTQVQPKDILNSQTTGIYSLFNLMKVYSSKDGSFYKGVSNSDLLFYLQSIVMDIEFQGLYIQLTMNEFLNAHHSEIVNKKRQADPQFGGAPWLNPDVSVLKLSNNPQQFNSINSGIYNAQKLRSLTQIEGNTYSSSVYQVFKSEWDDVTVTYTSENKIRGTNLFGFQTKIQQNDNIEGYFDMVYQAQALTYKNSLVWKNEDQQQIDAFRFQVDSTKSIQVNVEQLANKTVELNSDTYFIVEPNTGLTLEMHIKYTVSSKPFYTEYLQKNKTSSFPLYQGQIYYTNHNTASMVGISRDEHTLKVLFLMGIILSSVFVVLFIVMLVLHRKARKGNKFGEQNKSLMSSENGSLAY